MSVTILDTLIGEGVYPEPLDSGEFVLLEIGGKVIFGAEELDDGSLWWTATAFGHDGTETMIFNDSDLTNLARTLARRT